MSLLPSLVFLLTTLLDGAREFVILNLRERILLKTMIFETILLEYLYHSFSRQSIEVFFLIRKQILI